MWGMLFFRGTCPSLLKNLRKNNILAIFIGYCYILTIIRGLHTDTIPLANPFAGSPFKNFDWICSLVRKEPNWRPDDYSLYDDQEGRKFLLETTYQQDGTLRHSVALLGKTDRGWALLLEAFAVSINGEPASCHLALVVLEDRPSEKPRPSLSDRHAGHETTPSMLVIYSTEKGWSRTYRGTFHGSRADLKAMGANAVTFEDLPPDVDVMATTESLFSHLERRDFTTPQLVLEEATFE